MRRNFIILSALLALVSLALPGFGSSHHEERSYCGPNAANNPDSGASTAYVNSSHTFQDVIRIDLARLTVHNRWYWGGGYAWQHDLNFGTYHGWCQIFAHASGLNNTWHIKNLWSPYYDWGDCLSIGPCGNTLTDGAVDLHTDWVWCNLTSDWQQASIKQGNYGYSDGTFWVDFWDLVHCPGVVHATKAWKSSSREPD